MTVRSKAAKSKPAAASDSEAPKPKRAPRKPRPAVAVVPPPEHLEILAATQATMEVLVVSMDMVRRSVAVVLAKLVSLEQQVSIVGRTTFGESAQQQPLMSPLRHDMSFGARSSAASTPSRASVSSAALSPIGSGSKSAAIALKPSALVLGPSPTQQTIHHVIPKVCCSLRFTW